MAAAARYLKFGGQIRELRLHLCQTSEASKGVRDFMEKHYVNLKTNNPAFPILVRECSGIYPKVYARFAKGKETSLPLTGLNADQVLGTINKLAESK